ncbi:MAG TPA: NAD(P)-binding domain-containing protein, partial [Noviherbaspirillum sp.]
HLRQSKADFRILGKPMQSWLTNMPKGMLLKSAGFASSLDDPGNTFPLRRYCKENGLPYEDIDFPVPLETFCAYAMEFQERFVPNVEDGNVVAIKQLGDEFELQMESGGVIMAHNVVVAVGLNNFRHVPAELAHLPKEYLSHSADHHDLRAFKGKDVLVIGSGSSATDIAILLHEKFGNVRLIARQARIDFGERWGNASLPFLQRIRQPISGIGPGLRSFLWAEAPWLYRHFSDQFRIATARNFLGPSGGWFMKERARNLPVLLGRKVTKARIVSGGRVQLTLSDQEGNVSLVQADHVIAATGYKIDVARIPFLARAIHDRLDLIGDAPRLSAQFESSVPGLYFAGPIAATTFGPVMRFMAGAGFTAKRISTHLAKSMERKRGSRGWKGTETRTPYHG